jgi:hypothetical protein
LYIVCKDHHGRTNVAGMTDLEGSPANGSEKADVAIVADAKFVFA